MQSLNEKTWDEFYLNDIFGFKLAKGDNQPKNMNQGRIPVVSAGETNNGVTAFVSNPDEGSVFQLGTVTVDMFGKAFWHGYDYCAVSHGRVNILDLNVPNNSSQFISTCIDEGTISKYSYNQMCSQKRLTRQKVMLPVTDSGEPDYEYMAEYTRQMRETMLAKYRAYVEARIAELGEYVEIPALDEKEWKPIFISSMFELVRGRENNMAMLEDGDTPLISAKANNNGLKGFVHNPKKIIAGQCITLNNDGDGGAGLAYYQPANMALDSHVTALVPLIDMSAFVMLFIAKCISGLHGFFGHGLSISNPRAKRLRIMLPVTDSGEPDYKYMEQYSKNMMLRKYQQYLTFLHQRSNTR